MEDSGRSVSRHVSYAFDANVLVYASDSASPHHAGASAFLAGRVADPDLCCLAWPTLMAYLRIATHPGIFAHPLAPADAWRNVRRLLALPRVTLIGEPPGFADVIDDLWSRLIVRGNLVPDAHLAAILQANGVRRLYTRDSDFRKFPFLEVVDPLA